MNKSLKSKRHIDNVVNRIKATNQAREEQSTKVNDPDTDTDYANIITIKKADAPQANPHDSNTTQQNPTTQQPQHSSTPTQQENLQQPQTAEHDSTEPQIDTTTNYTDQQPQNTDSNTIPTTKSSEQSPIPSLNTEDIEELNKLIFD